MREGYQMNVSTGDIVLLPCGTLGIVNHWDIVEAGHCKEVRVYPLTNWLHRLFLTLTKKIWFYDEQINNLTPVILASLRPRQF